MRISLDAKATVKVGPFSRGGKSRVQVEAADHDFKPQATLTPVGILMPTCDEVFLYWRLLQRDQRLSCRLHPSVVGIGA